MPLLALAGEESYRRDGMDPYAKPTERKTGENRPKIPHRPPEVAKQLTRRQRDAEKRGVAAERRAIKKSARRHLRRQLEDDLADL